MTRTGHLMDVFLCSLSLSLCACVPTCANTRTRAHTGAHGLSPATEGPRAVSGLTGDPHCSPKAWDCCVLIQLGTLGSQQGQADSRRGACFSDEGLGQARFPWWASAGWRGPLCSLQPFSGTLGPAGCRLGRVWKGNGTVSRVAVMLSLEVTGGGCGRKVRPVRGPGPAEPRREQGAWGAGEAVAGQRAGPVGCGSMRPVQDRSVPPGVHRCLLVALGTLLAVLRAVWGWSGRPGVTSRRRRVSTVNHLFQVPPRHLPSWPIDPQVASHPALCVAEMTLNLRSLSEASKGWGAGMCHRVSVGV